MPKVKFPQIGACLHQIEHASVRHRGAVKYEDFEVRHARNMPKRIVVEMANRFVVKRKIIKPESVASLQGVAGNGR